MSKLKKRLSTLSILAGLTAVLFVSHAEVTVNPTGFAVALGGADTLETVLTLSNDGEQDLGFDARYQFVPGGEQRMQGPHRDQAGDTLQQVNVPYFNTVGMAWDPDNHLMWGLAWTDRRLWALNPDNGQAAVNVAVNQSMLGLFCVDGVLIAGGYNNNVNTLFRYDTRGNALDNWRIGQNLTWTTIGGDDRYIYTLTYQVGGGQGNVNVFDMQNNMEQVGSIDFSPWIGDDGWGIEIIPAHQRAKYWVCNRDHLYQFTVDNDWHPTLVQSFATVVSSHCGLAHDGENLWRGIYDGATRIWYVIDDGIVEALQFTLDPASGVVPAQNTEDIGVQLISYDCPDGVYNFQFTIDIGNGGRRDDPISTIELSALVSVGNQAADITGRVTDATNDEPLPGVTVSLDGYEYTRMTDEEGAYLMASLPVGVRRVTFTKPDYLPFVQDVELGEEGAELSVSLLHSECNLNPDQVARDIAPNSDTHVQFSATNGGNGPLSYAIDRRLIGDANAAPWEDRRDFNAGTALNDDRIEGVAFDGEHFYFAGANGNNPNTIYIVDRDGNDVDHFTQLGASQYGMKDLEWDGELLWGAGYLQNVYGFTPNGDSVISFQTAYNPTGNIAYDSDEDLLWVSGTTSNISAYDRQGHAANRTLNRKGLKVYGLSYWPEDPDGYKLYIFDQPAVGLQMVHKMNTANGDTMLAHSIPTENGEAPSGIFICNTFDVYSWVMMSMHNIAPANGSDRLSIWQLAARKEWMLVDPTAGVVQAGEHQDFDLHLDATGLPAVEFRGELVFTHDGVHGETILPITLNVVEGPVHSERTLQLALGWNLVSVNLQPDNPDLRVITQDLYDRGIFVIMKDGFGNFFVPGIGWEVDPWDVAQGYFIKVNQDATLDLAGVTVMADDPIQLDRGWQLISYYPRRPIEATVALAGIADHLIIAKDGHGGFYLPSHHFSNMGDMVEGQGYQVKSDAEVELVYQTGGRMDMVETGGTPMLPAHYPVHPVTGSNMSVLMNLEFRMKNFECGEIGVFTENGLCVGSASFQIPNSKFQIGLAVWGDDPTTPAKDGADENDALSFRLWDGESESTLPVRLLEGKDCYEADGIAVFASETVLPETAVLIEAYPNPFNSMTSIRYSLPEAANIRMAVYDLGGREVATLILGSIPAGTHSATWSADGVGAGVYFLKFAAGDQTAVKKLLVVK